MERAEMLAGLRPLRISGEPDGSRPLALALLSGDLPRLVSWLKEHKNYRISHIFLADVAPGTPITARLPPWHGRPRFLGGLGELASIPPDTDIVFPFPREWLARTACMGLPALAARPLWLAGNEDQQLCARSPLPDYYDKNKNALESAAASLASDADRLVFWRRVKAIMTGDPGYLPVAPHMEYEHPSVAPARGDIMLDGGVSDMVGAQERFAEQVGETGVIHGFEPIAWMAAKAAASLAPWPQYRLHNAGLADKTGEAVFASLRDSSHLGAAGGEAKEVCRLVAIDDFARSMQIPRIDCLKLDIEGAELAALQGGAATIARDLPKLIVCLYHRPRDLYEIPLYVKELCPDYVLRIAHSGCGFTDTILYADAPVKKGGMARGGSLASG